MTDRGRALVTLVLVPLTAGLFGAGVMWADANDPSAPAPATAVPVDSRIDQLAAQVATAQARVAAVRAILDQRSAGAAAPRAGSEGTPTSPPASAPPAPAAAAPVPPPPVDTMTKASG